MATLSRRQALLGALATAFAKPQATTAHSSSSANPANDADLFYHLKKGDFIVSDSNCGARQVKKIVGDYTVTITIFQSLPHAANEDSSTMYSMMQIDKKNGSIIIVTPSAGGERSHTLTRYVSNNIGLQRNGSRSLRWDEAMIVDNLLTLARMTLFVHDKINPANPDQYRPTINRQLECSRA